MIKKASLKKKTKYIVSRWAKKYGLLKTMQSISREKYAEKISASLFYGLLSAIAVNFFFQPGHVYSSGATGLAQVLSAISERVIGFKLPISIVFYAINIPLLILAWYKIGHKFTVFTLITVSMSSFFLLSHSNNSVKSASQSFFLSASFTPSGFSRIRLMSNIINFSLLIIASNYCFVDM